ncbi:MAG: universal stress protein [Gammaproteobacteria bacterium]|nr:universal stress protein [Gammaproteobacteria bacterium]NNJ95306.1 universal stress protein [Halobacteria archaeon]
MKLLVAVDLSASTEKIVKKVEEIAKEIPAKVWILHNAVPEPDTLEFRVDPRAARESLAKKFHDEHCQIQEIADRLRKSGVETTALLVHGATVETILKEASDVCADMIVVGSHGRGAMYELVVGSISKGVLHKSTIPVLVVPTHKRS